MVLQDEKINFGIALLLLFVVVDETDSCRNVDDDVDDEIEVVIVLHQTMKQTTRIVTENRDNEHGILVRNL